MLFEHLLGHQDLEPTAPIGLGDGDLARETGWDAGGRKRRQDAEGRRGARLRLALASSAPADTIGLVSCARHHVGASWLRM